MAVFLAHCGAGSSEEVADAARKAVARGLDVLRGGGSALDAVVEAVVILEDDPRLNAGTGSRLNLDGRAEMDASLMDSEFGCGAVAAIIAVKNPILVARKVLDSPHILLCGEGAVRFARKAGFAEFSSVTSRSIEALEEVKKRLKKGDVPSWALRWKRYMGGDTVGAVARDDHGRVAAANSTGGVSIKLPGRVGDTPLIGCGIYAGPKGAVTATGVGEEIIRRVLCKAVYDQITSGAEAQEACEEGLTLFPADVPVGLIAVDGKGWGAACNTDMAWAQGTL